MTGTQAQAALQIQLGVRAKVQLELTHIIWNPNTLDTNEFFVISPSGPSPSRCRGLNKLRHGHRPMMGPPAGPPGWPGRAGGDLSEEARITFTTTTQ